MKIFGIGKKYLKTDEDGDGLPLDAMSFSRCEIIIVLCTKIAQGLVANIPSIVKNWLELSDLSVKNPRPLRLYSKS